MGNVTGPNAPSGNNVGGLPDIEAPASGIGARGRTATVRERARIAQTIEGFVGGATTPITAPPPGGVTSPDAAPPPQLTDPNAAITTARAQAGAGDVEAALTTLRAIINDTSVPAADRARAALAASEITFAADGTNARAQLFFLEAQRLDPTLDVRRQQARLLWAEGRTDEALVIINALVTANPTDVGLWRAKAALMLTNADRAGALTANTEALRLATAQGMPEERLNDIRLQRADLLFENRRSADAIAIFRQILASPSATEDQLLAAHTGLAEILPAPNFGTSTTETAANRTGPHAAQINGLFNDANTAYRNGDFARVKTLAEQILALAPNDGLAHQMWSIAVRSQRQAATPMIPALDTPEKRAALRDRFTAICATARVGTPPRAATPRDLFPEWDQLNEQQQASVAHSVLSYGNMIPAVIEMGAQYHLALPGTSAAFLDPNTRPAQHNDFNRHFYAVRGWFNPTNFFIVTGTEDIDGAMRGGYNTVGHEFAHLVHGVMQRAHNIPAATRTPAQQRLADQFDRIHALFVEAQSGANGQHFLDAYSSNNEFEYFGQGMEALLHPEGEDSRRLFSRNPNLWHFVTSFARANEDFPPALPDGTSYDAGTRHPPVGQNAVGSPFTLDRLERTGARAFVRPEAAATLRHLDALVNPGTAPNAPAFTVGTPAAPRFHTGPYTLPDTRSLSTEVRAGNFEAAVASARRINDHLQRGDYNAAQLREVASAYAEALQAAEAGAQWSWWQILLSIFTLGIGAIVIHCSKAEARQLRDMLRERLPQERQQEIFTQLGETYAANGGLALANFRASEGDAALRTRIEAGIRTAHPDWDNARVQQAAGWVMQGIAQADRAHTTPAPEAVPNAGSLTGPARADQQRLLLQRAGELAQIDAGLQPANFLGNPEAMIGIMGLDELQAQVTAELQQADALLARADLPAAERPHVEEARRQILALQAEIITARREFFSDSRTRGPGELPATLARLRGVPPPSGPLGGPLTGLLGVHTVLTRVTGTVPAAPPP